MNNYLPKHSGFSSQPRAISDIIESLNYSFLPSDFKEAIGELTAREEGLKAEKDDIIVSLREKNDFFEEELNQLRLEKIQWEEERRRLRGELDLNDVKLNDIMRELGLVKEEKENVIEKFDGLCKEFEELKVEKLELIQNLVDVTDIVDVLKRKSREKDKRIDELTRGYELERDARLEELREIRKKIECLEGEKRKLNARLERLKRKEEESLSGMAEMNEDERRRVECRFKAKLEEVEDVRRKVAFLVEQRAESDRLIENLRRCEREKDERIKKLSRDIENLVREHTDAVKEKDRKIRELEKENKELNTEKRKVETMYGKVEEMVEKLEGDLMTCLSLGLGRTKNFASSQIGEIFSRIVNSLDSEDLGLACNAGIDNEGDIQKADSTINFHVMEPSHGMMSNVVKKGIQCSGSLNKHQIHDISDDDSLNRKLKSKKTKLSEQVEQEFLSSKSYQKLNSPHRNSTLVAVKEFEDKLGGEITGPRSCNFAKDYDTKRAGNKNYCGTPKVEDVRNSYIQRKQNKSLKCRADLICALDEDIDLCAKAVCALHRRRKNCVSLMKGSERMTALAEYLIDGHPRGKMMKSVDELLKHDPKGPEDCREFAKQQSKQLMDIYKKREDPFFSPLSTDLQYK